MKQVFRKIGLGSLMAAALLVASASILPAATTDIDDIVQDLAKVKEVGENISATCDTMTTNLDKRGRLAYDRETGSLKYDVSTAEDAR